MADLTVHKREGFLRSEAVFCARAIAIMIESGVLDYANYGQHAKKQLRILLEEWESSNPSPKQPAEQEDIDRIRKALGSRP